MTEFQVRRFDGLNQIEGQRDSWQELLRRRPANRPFSGPGFTIAALRAYHEKQNPTLWCADNNGALEAVLPIVPRPLTRLGAKIREVGFPFNPNFILNDPLFPEAPPNDAKRIAEGILCAVFERRVDTILLDHLISATGTVNAVLAAAENLDIPFDEPMPSRSLYFIRLSGSYESYLGTRSRNHRWQLKKIVHRANEAGGFDVQLYRGREQILAAAPTWFAIERASRQGAHPQSAMTDDDRRFHLLLLDDLAEDEVGDLWITRIDGQPAAALRMLGGTHRVAVHTMHFDQRFKHLVPGILCFQSMLRDAFDRGLREVDMHGNTQFFQRWATHKRDHTTIRLYRPTFRGKTLQRGRRLLRATDEKLPEKPA